MTKSVDPSMYDRAYFSDHLAYKPDSVGDFKTEIWEIMLTLVDIDNSDKIIDFGCGSGLLSFYLNKRYGAEVIGLDYSSDAIEICNELLKKFIPSGNGISFSKLTIDKFPDTSNVDMIVLADVIEHLYPTEVDALLTSIVSYREAAIRSTSLKLLLHTDNILFLNYVRPILDILGFLFLRTDLKVIRDRNAFEDARHVNLYSASSLTRHLSRFGFVPIKVIYPAFDNNRLAGQFPFLRKYPFLLVCIKFFFPLVRKFSPSFYALYEHV